MRQRTKSTTTPRAKESRHRIRSAGRGAGSVRSRITPWHILGLVLLAVLVGLAGFGYARSRRDAARAEAQAARDKALELIATGKGTEALAVIEPVAKTLADDARAQFVLGLAYYQRQELEKAQEAYLRAIELDPENAEAYNNSGNVYRDMANRAASNGDAKEAERLRGLAVQQYRRAIEISPQFAYPYTNLSIVLEQQGDQDGALNVLKEGAEANLANLDIKASYGTLALQMGRCDEARQAFEAILAVNPADKSAVEQLNRAKTECQATSGD